MESIQCDISLVTQIEQDVLLIDILPDSDIELKDLNQIIEAALKLGNGKKFYNIINVGDFTSPSHAVRLIIASKERAELKKADAFIIRTFPQKIIANFYMSFYKPVAPTKFFNNMNDAKKWIEMLQTKEKLKGEL